MSPHEVVVRNPIDWRLVELRRHKVYQLKQNTDKTVHGIDTETLDGYARLIADGRGNYALTDTADAALEFLTAKRYRSSANFFFNLNYDVNAVIKYLPVESLVELRETKRTEYDGYSIFYIPKKVLRITKNKHVCKFYDVMQFYDTSLENAALKYLGLDKYVEPIDRAVLGTSADYWRDNLDSIVRYCISDASLTQKLGEILAETLYKAIELKPNAFISKASITKEYVRKACHIPDILRVPRNALKYGFYAYSGGRFEILKKGNVGKCTLYDINSAYPYHIQNLLDITRGRWLWSRDMHENADYGFYLARIMTKYNKISPLPITLTSGVICYPLTEVLTYITKQELEAYEQDIEYQIIDGWEFYADEYVYPFRDYIERVYSLKNQVKAEGRTKDYEYSLYKILMNSLYGAFYEKNVQEVDGEVKVVAGKLFNPFYATLITALTRIQLWQLARPYVNDVVGFATDSVLFQGDPEIPSSKELGGWALEPPALAETVVLRSGIYKTGDTLKNRGIKKASRLDTPYGQFNDIFDYIAQRPELLTYPIKMNRPLNFIEVLHQHLKRDVSDINRFVDIEYDIDINRDLKRLWHGEFANGGELLTKSIDSDPLVLEITA